MSNFDKAVEIIGELATEYGQPGGDELFGLDEDAALALKTAGLLAPDARVIRTQQELETLDPDTCTLDKFGDFDFAKAWIDENGKMFVGHVDFLPAVVFATGDQVRAAREAMEVENDF